MEPPKKPRRRHYTTFQKVARWLRSHRLRDTKAERQDRRKK